MSSSITHVISSPSTAILSHVLNTESLRTDMQVERMDGVSAAAKATETARTERLAMGKTGEWL